MLDFKEYSFIIYKECIFRFFVYSNVTAMANNIRDFGW